MAITSTLTTSFKKELLTATHNFATGGNSFGTTAFTDFADLTFGTATITARGCMIYNDTAAGDPSVATIDFGGDKTSTAGDFTIVFPAAASSTAIIRIA
jgi:hypothetical protein